MGGDRAVPDQRARLARGRRPGVPPGPLGDRPDARLGVAGGRRDGAGRRAARGAALARARPRRGRVRAERGLRLALAD